MRSKRAAPEHAHRDRFGDHIGSIGSKGDLERGQFRIRLWPWRIAVSADGKLLYVACRNACGVHVLSSSDGSYVRQFRDDNALIDDVSAICVHGDLLVVAEEGRKVFVFNTLDESLVRTIDRPGASDVFSVTTGVCVFDDLVYVCEDGASSCVQEFSLSEGALLRTIGARGSEPSVLGDFNGVCLSPDGSLMFVIDTANYCVHVFRTLDGARVNSFGTKGPGVGQFNYPTEVRTSPSGEWLFVVESRNKRVQALRLRGSDVDGMHAHTIGGDVLHGLPLGCAVCPTSGLLYVTDTAGVDRVHAFAL